MSMRDGYDCLWVLRLERASYEFGNVGRRDLMEVWGTRRELSRQKRPDDGRVFHNRRFGQSTLLSQIVLELLQGDLPGSRRR
jgi:hypothetical protein